MAKKKKAKKQKAISSSAVEKFHERAVYLVLDWSFPGTWRGVDPTILVSITKRDEVRTTKRIIKSKAIERLRTLRSRTKHLLGRYTLNTLFRPGIYAIPIDFIPHVEEQLKKASDEIEVIRAALIKEWPTIIEDAKSRLGKQLYDEQDYANPEWTASELNMSFRYIPIAHTPQILKAVAADVYKDDLERSNQQATAELEGFRDSLRASLLLIVQNMQKTLTKPTGERRVFGKRFFKNLNSFLETFEGRNFSEDGELKKVVASARKVASGYDFPETLKVDSNFQEALNSQLMDISGQLEGMVEEGRVIDLSLAS